MVKVILLAEGSLMMFNPPIPWVILRSLQLMVPRCVCRQPKYLVYSFDPFGVVASFVINYSKLIKMTMKIGLNNIMFFLPSLRLFLWLSSFLCFFVLCVVLGVQAI